MSNETQVSGQSWIILRCAGRDTIRLAATLAEDGFNTWSPIESKSIRLPRKNVRREVTLPIMPSYVFARAEQLLDLLELAAMPVRPRRQANRPAHASFSVMRHGETIPLISDRHLAALRHIEAKRAPRKRAARVHAPGVSVIVKIDGGSFAGMKGVVERADEHTTLVLFDRRMTVRIATCLLDEDALRPASSLSLDAVPRAA